MYDTLYDIANFLFDTLRTLVLYGAGPILLATKRKKPIRQKWLSLFCILCTVFGWLIISIPRMLLLNAEPVSGLVAIILERIFYKRASEILAERGLLITQ